MMAMRRDQLRCQSCRLHMQGHDHYRVPVLVSERARSPDEYPCGPCVWLVAAHEPTIASGPSWSYRALAETIRFDPCPGPSTTTVAPVFTRLYRSMMSSLVSRMQPDEIACPIHPGWFVPWMRYSVSCPLA